MPIIKSAKKRMRQTAKNHGRNLTTKRSLRQSTKDLQSLIDAKDFKKAGEALKSVYSSLDTAVKKNVIHRNKAARKKSIYNAKVKALANNKTTVRKVAPKKPATKAKAPVKKTSTTKKPTPKK